MSARLAELATLGVDQFAIYLQHDAKEATLAAYGETIVSAVTAGGGYCPMNWLVYDCDGSAGVPIT